MSNYLAVSVREENKQKKNKKQSHVKHAWKHLRENSSPHVALQSKLTASFNNDPALLLHGVYRGDGHTEWVVTIDNTLSHYLCPLFL